MSEKIGRLIKERRQELGLTLDKVGAACGVGKSTVRKWETGLIKNMRRDKIAMLADILRLDPTDLIDSPAHVVALPAGIIPLSDLEQYKVPLVGSVAAGTPIYDEEWPGEYVDAPVNADFAIKVKGDSMEPDYFDGDLIYIRRLPDVPHDGAVCAMAIDDETTLKHVYRHDTGVMLTSNNPAYSPMIYSAAEHTIRVLGIPLGFTRIYK